MSDEKRPYRKKRRAELEAETRLRITESAVELHGTLGPSRTSMSAVAERAGVRRSTLYRHFPDEQSLFMACSAHWRDANPRPDVDRWAAIEDPAKRLATALEELYGYYRQTEPMLANLMRDQATEPMVARLFSSFHDYMTSATDALMTGRRRRRLVRAAIGHGLSFSTWQSLTRDQGLGDREAAGLACRLVEEASARA